MAGDGRSHQDAYQSEINDLAGYILSICSVDLGRLNAPVGVGPGPVPLGSMFLWDADRLTRIGKWQRRGDELSDKWFVAKVARAVLALRELREVSENLSQEDRVTVPIPSAQPVHVSASTSMAPTQLVLSGVSEPKVVVRKRKAPCAALKQTPISEAGSLSATVQTGAMVAETNSTFKDVALMCAGQQGWSGQLAWARGTALYKPPVDVKRMLYVWGQTFGCVWVLLLACLTWGPAAVVFFVVAGLLSRPESICELLAVFLSAPGWYWDFLMTRAKQSVYGTPPRAAWSVYAGNPTPQFVNVNEAVMRSQFQQAGVSNVTSGPELPPGFVAFPAQGLAAPPAQPAPWSQIVGAAGVGAAAWNGGTFAMALLHTRLTGSAGLNVFH